MKEILSPLPMPNALVPKVERDVSTTFKWKYESNRLFFGWKLCINNSANWCRIMKVVQYNNERWIWERKWTMKFECNGAMLRFHMNRGATNLTFQHYLISRFYNELKHFHLIAKFVQKKHEYNLPELQQKIADNMCCPTELSHKKRHTRANQYGRKQTPDCGFKMSTNPNEIASKTSALNPFTISDIINYTYFHTIYSKIIKLLAK